MPVIDPHVRNLLRFPPGKDLHDHPLVNSGALILQDKSSCFSAQILADAFIKECITEDENKKQCYDMIDACAAPGNKTSHLASLLSPVSASSTVFAFDKSSPRLNVLKRRMKEASADHIVTPLLQSFLEVNPYDIQYQNVIGILLDPSCSGSGMASRLDHFMDDSSKDSDDQDGRLKSLSDFQKEALLHAFTFPNVQYVVYSTCSVHNEENEHVVQHALMHENNGAPASTTMGPFHLIAALPTWKRRGRNNVGLTDEQAKCLVRVDPREDNTNGFFVALFERGGQEREKRRKKNAKRKEKRKRAKQKAAAAVAATANTGGDDGDGGSTNGSKKKKQKKR